jgi:MoaA/NifB/PqqE/SkfB family radical SAM enzyme
MTYIGPHAKVLRHLDRLAAWNRGEKPAPVTVEWDLSNRCTLGCQDCHFAHTHVRGPWAVKPRLLPMAYQDTGDLADTPLVMRALEEMRDAGVQAIVWSGGGEPTTHPDWLFLAEYAATLGLQQGMYTHGGLLTPATAARFAAIASWVVVSLDAADAATYARDKGVPQGRFAAACTGLTSLIGKGAIVGASFLIHRDNWRKAESMLALARGLGATYTTFRPAIRTSPDNPSVCTDDREWIAEALDLDAFTTFRALAAEPDVEIDMERFTDYAEWRGHGYQTCRGIQLNTTVTPDGRVWVCPQRRGVTPIGDLREESFAEVWKKHPRSFAVDAGCRVMCRLHPLNQTLAAIATPRAHEAFL